MNSEMKSAKWLWSGIALQFSIGFTVAFAVYQIGTLLTVGTVGTAFVPGLAVVAVIAAVVAVLIIRTNRTADRTARVFVKE